MRAALTTAMALLLATAATCLTRSDRGVSPLCKAALRRPSWRAPPLLPFNVAADAGIDKEPLRLPLPSNPPLRPQRQEEGDHTASDVSLDDGQLHRSGHEEGEEEEEGLHLSPPPPPPVRAAAAHADSTSWQWTSRQGAPASSSSTSSSSFGSSSASSGSGSGNPPLRQGLYVTVFADRIMHQSLSGTPCWYLLNSSMARSEFYLFINDTSVNAVTLSGLDSVLLHEGPDPEREELIYLLRQFVREMRVVAGVLSVEAACAAGKELWTAVVAYQNATTWSRSSRDVGGRVLADRPPRKAETTTTTTKHGEPTTTKWEPSTTKRDATTTTTPPAPPTPLMLDATLLDGAVIEVAFWQDHKPASDVVRLIDWVRRTLVPRNRTGGGPMNPPLSPWFDGAFYIGVQVASGNNGVTKDDLVTLSPAVDLLFLLAYEKNPHEAFAQSKKHLDMIFHSKDTSICATMLLAVVWSAEGPVYTATGDAFMGDWIASNAPASLANAATIFESELSNNYPTTFGSRFVGFQTFEYFFALMYMRQAFPNLRPTETETTSHAPPDTTAPHSESTTTRGGGDTTTTPDPSRDTTTSSPAAPTTTASGGPNSQRSVPSSYVVVTVVSAVVVAVLLALFAAHRIRRSRESAALAERNALLGANDEPTSISRSSPRTNDVDGFFSQPVPRQQSDPYPPRGRVALQRHLNHDDDDDDDGAAVEAEDEAQHREGGEAGCVTNPESLLQHGIRGAALQPPSSSGGTSISPVEAAAAAAASLPAEAPPTSQQAPASKQS